MGGKRHCTVSQALSRPQLPSSCPAFLEERELTAQEENLRRQRLLLPEAAPQDPQAVEQRSHERTNDTKHPLYGDHTPYTPRTRAVEHSPVFAVQRHDPVEQVVLVPGSRRW